MHDFYISTPSCLTAVILTHPVLTLSFLDMESLITEVTVSAYPPDVRR